MRALVPPCCVCSPRGSLPELWAVGILAFIMKERKRKFGVKKPDPAQVSLVATAVSVRERVRARCQKIEREVLLVVEEILREKEGRCADDSGHL